MASNYVPGYGYVDSNDPGTKGSVKKGPKRVDTWGQRPDFTPFYAGNRYIPPPSPIQPTVSTLEFPSIKTTDVSSSDDAYRAQRAARMGMLPEDNTYSNEGYAQAVADVTDGYVVETAPGVFEVKYGIWAANAAVAANQVPSHLNVAEPTSDPARTYGPGQDATIVGSTYDASVDPYIAVDRDPREYVIYNDQAQIPQGIGEMNVTTYEKMKDRGDAAALGVYMGTVTTAGSTGANAVDVVKDARIVSDYTMLSDQEQEKVLELTAKYYKGMAWQRSWIEKRWAKAVTSANKRLMLYGEKITPFEVYDRMIAIDRARDAEKNATGGGYGGGGYGGGGYGGGGATSTIRLTSSSDARVILNQAMKSYLGRDATAEEISRFVQLLNAQERANPIVQEYSGDTALQYGGFNPQTFAEDFARSKNGSSEYQAATTFLDALMGALGGNTGVI